MNIKEAIDLTTDHGMIVTEIFRKRSNGKTSNAFKVGYRGGVMMTAIQLEKGSRLWRVGDKEKSFIGLQSQCIVKCVEWLK